jgi:hypothetical protein
VCVCVCVLGNAFSAQYNRVAVVKKERHPLSRSPLPTQKEDSFGGGGTIITRLPRPTMFELNTV